MYKPSLHLQLNKRNVTVDIMRTTATLLMIVFHLLYDLYFLDVVPFEFATGKGWILFRWCILILFFLCVGISLQFTHGNGVEVKSWLFSTVRLITCAIAISIGSYFFIPNNWIFFGVLHFIALSYIMAIPFIRHPFIALFTGIMIVTVGTLQLIPSRWPFHLVFDSLPRYTNDYVQISPWFGVVLLGIYFSQTGWIRDDVMAYKLPSVCRPWVERISRHSLGIYLIHQPILFAMLYGLIELGALFKL